MNDVYQPNTEKKLTELLGLKTLNDENGINKKLSKPFGKKKFWLGADNELNLIFVVKKN